MITFVVDLLDEELIEEITRLKLICENLEPAVESKKKSRKKVKKTDKQLQDELNKILGITEEQILQQKIQEALNL